MQRADYERSGKLIRETGIKLRMTPTIALFAGDPAGIGPELVAKVLADRGELPRRAHPPDRAQGQPRLRPCAWRTWTSTCRRSRVDANSRRPRALSRVPVGRMECAGVRAAARRGPPTAPSCSTRCGSALDLAGSGEVQAVCFAPLNKAALRAGGMKQEDELRWFADVLEHRGPCGEFNVLEKLWTSRVTSHVALREVAGLLTAERVAEAIGMLYDALRLAGNADAAHRRVRTESAQRRQRQLRTRGDRRHRARRQARGVARPSCRRAVSGGHDLRARARTAPSTASSPCITTRARSR